jgi:hypothetical protein
MTVKSNLKGVIIQAQYFLQQMVMINMNANSQRQIAIERRFVTESKSYVLPKVTLPFSSSPHSTSSLQILALCFRTQLINESRALSVKGAPAFINYLQLSLRINTVFCKYLFKTTKVVVRLHVN